MSVKRLLTVGSCASDQDEYWYHVASQEEMPLAGTTRPPRLLKELDRLFPTSDDYVAGSLTSGSITAWLRENPALAEQLRLVLSLSDKRFYLDLSYRFSREPVPGTSGTICGCLPHAMKKHSTNALLKMMDTGSEARRESAARAVAAYLTGRGLLVVLDLYFGLDQVRRTAVNDIWLAPHDVQQNETKRRGHGAEAEIARALQDAGVALIPANKASDPMGAPDPNVSLKTFDIAPRVVGETVSADIAVRKPSGKLQVIIMGLVQSSDPGQFGVDKAATNGSIRERLDQYRRRTGATLELWGIIDGIGYAENPNGTINRMLRHFDFFVQHNSAYKAILGASRLRLCRVTAIRYDKNFYSETTARQMHDKYAGRVRMLSAADPPPARGRAVKAGRAVVWIA
jgi:hypothetical protein